jgi:hypothetical protein
MSDQIEPSMELLEDIAAWQAGNRSEEAVARMHGLQVIDLREILFQVLERASQRWAAWRSANPPRCGQHSGASQG